MDAESWWKIGDKLIGFGGLVAGGVATLGFKTFRRDRAMLYRHDEHVRSMEGELGQFKSFRETCTRGPLGESLVKVIDELKEQDERLHKRVSSYKRTTELINNKMAAMETDIQWVKETLERIESKLE